MLGELPRNTLTLAFRRHPTRTVTVPPTQSPSVPEVRPLIAPLPVLGRDVRFANRLIVSGCAVWADSHRIRLRRAVAPSVPMCRPSVRVGKAERIVAVSSRETRPHRHRRGNRQRDRLTTTTTPSPPSPAGHPPRGAILTLDGHSEHRQDGHPERRLTATKTASRHTSTWSSNLFYPPDID